MQTNKKAVSPEQLEILENRVKRADLQIVAELGKTEISIEDFLLLQPQDVIQLNQKIEDPLVLRIGDVPKFSVQPGKLKKRMAIQVIEPLKGGDENDE